MIGKALILLGAIALSEAKSPLLRDADPICETLEFEEQLLSYAEDCTKFYQCSNGAAIVHKCSPGLHFNFEKQVCDHPEDANCKQALNVPNDGYEQQAVRECLVDEAEGLLLPHEFCDKFYKCSHGEAVVQNCPAGLYYETSKNICEWAQNVVCDDRKTPKEKGIFKKAEEDKVNSNVNEPAIICANDDAAGRKLPHENCKFFYQCSMGVPEILMCPDGEQFNAKKRQCRVSKDAACSTNGRRRGLQYRILNDLYTVS